MTIKGKMVLTSVALRPDQHAQAIKLAGKDSIASVVRDALDLFFAKHSENLPSEIPSAETMEPTNQQAAD